MIENMLVCLDGTKQGEAILPVAVEIARQCHSKIYLLDVMVRPSLLSGAGTVELEQIEECDLTDQEQAANSYLEDTAEAWRGEGVDIESIIVQGPLEETVLAAVRSFDIDLIALGTGGGNFLTRLLIGSLLERILKKTGLPVLGLNPGKAA